LVTTDKSLLHAEDEVAKLDVGLVVAASRHVSAKGIRAMLVHSVGNWGDGAEYGGRPRLLSKTSAYACYAALQTLREGVRGDLEARGWQVGLEVTHHGPYSAKPLIFVQLGSSIKEWGDKQLAAVVAEACVQACRSDEIVCPPAAVGFGGTHYAPRFSQLSLDGEAAFGHLAAKYDFPLDDRMVMEAFEQTIEQPQLAYIDWKSLRSEDRKRLEALLRSLGKQVLRV